MDKNSLVEDEGVNAGSADQIEDDGDPQISSAALRAGGRPDQVDPVAPVANLDPGSDGDDSDLLGAPDDDGRSPGQGHASAGQDAGSME